MLMRMTARQHGDLEKGIKMFEEIEKAHNDQGMILAPQNHANMFLSFVWDTTAKADDVESVTEA